MTKRLIITCMKNEGPFILEWVAHHLAVGFDHFLVFTNDCDDGTDTMLDALAQAGIVTRMDNPYRQMGDGYNPQKGALKFAQSLPLVRNADWILVSDVDEFVNIHAGDGHLDDLFAAVPDAALISMQWRLFGHGGHISYDDVLITERHMTCAPHYCPTPLQAWGIKTLFSTAGQGVAGAYNAIGVHRPLRRKTTEPPVWVNGSGVRLPDDYGETGWRFGIRDHGYDLVTLNYYAVRNCESFLVKRDRGRVNHIEHDQGLSYWMRMNFNMETDRSIQRRLPQTRAHLAQLHQIAGVTGLHHASVAAHRAKIASLMARDDMREFFVAITSEKLALISRHMNLFNRQQFDKGPQSVPDRVIAALQRVPVL